MVAQKITSPDGTQIVDDIVGQGPALITLPISHHNRLILVPSQSA